MINEIVKKIDGAIKESEQYGCEMEYRAGLYKAKEIILAEQKEPSWKQYIRERQITIIDDHCICGMAIDNGWEFCPKCGRQIKGRGYNIPMNRPLTKGDVIRESNESLAEVIADEDRCIRCPENYHFCDGDCEKHIAKYLNQPQEDTNE